MSSKSMGGFQAVAQLVGLLLHTPLPRSITPLLEPPLDALEGILGPLTGDSLGIAKAGVKKLTLSQIRKGKIH